MTMRDLAHNLHFRPAFSPIAAVTDGTAQVSATCDLLGYNSVALALITGTLTDSDAVWSVLIEESDDNAAFSAVAAIDLVYSQLEAGFTFADDGECRKIGYIGTKRYVRATVDDTTANTGNLFLAGMWVLTHAAMSPIAEPT